MPINNLPGEVENLRNEGLTDGLIREELTRQGHPVHHVNAMMAQDDIPVPMPGGGMAMPSPPPSYGAPPPSRSSSVRMSSDEGNIYERIEEMTENLIDEKWDDLISEVKRIVDWKEKVEEKQNNMMNDIKKLKEDFTILHQGILGKLDEYDSRMSDVGTELNAVGKVFKDVIPEFVENVKELKSITNKSHKS
jgi:hypothetical protein